MEQVIQQFHLGLLLIVVATDFSKRLSLGSFPLSCVGWSGEGALLLHLVELLHQLLEASSTDLLKCLLEGLASCLIRDIQLNSQILLELIEALGLLFGYLVDLY